MSEYVNCNFWFIPLKLDTFSVIHKGENCSIGLMKNGEFIKYTDGNISDEVICDFEKFKKCPEYELSSKVDTNILNAKQTYKTFLAGCARVRAYRNGHNPDNAQSQIDKIFDWLDSTDFFTAPASTVYHEAYQSGLVFHSLNVVKHCQSLKYLDEFHNADYVSAILCGLVHDWCKIGLYERYQKNQKNESTGQWEKVDAYKRREFNCPMGHGTASMFMVMQCMKITPEEAAAIRWHMGKWNVSENEVNEFQQSNEQFPLVHLIQFADQLSITKYA